MPQKFLGVSYPITRHHRGYFHTQGTVEQIKSDLLILLLTYPGERVMLPDFGTPLKDLVFEPNDFLLEKKAREIIAGSIRKWEHRVRIDDIEVLTGIEEKNRQRLAADDDLIEKDHILIVNIKFNNPDDIQKVEALRLEVPLGA
jgi:phage baseplate assembly protein W